MSAPVLRRFPADRRGNVAIIASLCATVLIGSAAFAIDAGSMFTARRTAQGAADLAALAAAGNPVAAAAIANANVLRNGIVLSKPLEVTTGTYVADPAVAPTGRFIASPAAGANAVRVTLNTRTPTYFGRLLRGEDTYPVRTTATAVSTAMASFSIGSRLASLHGGILNQILSQALGGSIDLSVMDYRSLGDLKVNTFDLLQTVAGEARVTGPTYDSVLSADITPLISIRSLKKLAAANPVANTQAIRVLTALERETRTATRIQLGGVIDPGPYRTLPLDQKPSASAEISALQVIGASARLASGEHQVAASLDLGVPQIANTKIAITIGERPVSSGWTATGRRGATVETAQTRLAINLSIAPVGALAAINLPIYVDIAKGKATLSNLACPRSGTGKSATVAVTPGIAEAWIADIPPANWERMAAVGSPPAAALTKVGLLQLQVVGSAHVRIGNQRPTDVTFTGAEIDGAATKTVRTTDYLNSLTASLVGDLKLGLKVGSVGVLLPAQELAIKSAISAVARPIDDVISTTLAFLGIGLGEVDVSVDAMRCDGAVLVN